MFKPVFKKAALVSSVVLAITACETADDNNIERARACVDNAMKLSLTNAGLAATNAATCETYVANLTSREAGKVAFMTTLVEQQKISQLATAAGALSQSSSAVGTSMSYLAYGTVAASSTMWTYASRSGSSGILKLAALIQVATIANAALAITAGNNGSVASAIAAITPGSQQETDAAAAVLVLQQSACAGADSTSSTCTKLTTAINGATTPNAILTNIKNAINAGTI